jgi:hypothetical protein
VINQQHPNSLLTMNTSDDSFSCEYETCNVVQLVVASVKQESDRLILQLGAKHTDCLAKELCVPSAAGKSAGGSC